MLDESEKRRFPRADFVFDLKYTTVDRDRSYITLSRDVSSGGISFQTDRMHEPGTVLMLHLGRHGMRNIIEAEGRIVRVWREGPSSYAAVAFTRIESEDREHLLSAVTPHP